MESEMQVKEEKNSAVAMWKRSLLKKKYGIVCGRPKW